MALLNYNVSEMLNDADSPLKEERMIDKSTPSSEAMDVVENKLKGFTFERGGYKFDRDEANDYDRF